MKTRNPGRVSYDRAHHSMANICQHNGTQYLLAGKFVLTVRFTSSPEDKI